jgi:hypothetical protein
MMRDVFEAGLNEAAGSLAAIYGRWWFVRNVERDAGGERPGRVQLSCDGSKRDECKSWGPDENLLGICLPEQSSTIDKARVYRCATPDRVRVNIG